MSSKVGAAVLVIVPTLAGLEAFVSDLRGPWPADRASAEQARARARTHQSDAGARRSKFLISLDAFITASYTRRIEIGGLLGMLRCAVRLIEIRLDMQLRLSFINMSYLSSPHHSGRLCSPSGSWNQRAAGDSELPPPV